MPTYPVDEFQSPEQPHHAPELERRLLRLSVREMATDRPCCSGCGRSPLTGERLLVFAAPAGEQRLCELCAITVDSDVLGDPIRTERVHAAERQLIIRRAA